MVLRTCVRVCVLENLPECLCICLTENVLTTLDTWSNDAVKAFNSNSIFCACEFMRFKKVESSVKNSLSIVRLLIDYQYKVAFWIVIRLYNLYCWLNVSNRNQEFIQPSLGYCVSHREEVRHNDVSMWFDLIVLVFNRSSISNNGKHNNETNLSHLMHWAMRPAIKKNEPKQPQNHNVCLS